MPIIIMANTAAFSQASKPTHTVLARVLSLYFLISHHSTHMSGYWCHCIFCMSYLSAFAQSVNWSTFPALVAIMLSLHICTHHNFLFRSFLNHFTFCYHLDYFFFDRQLMSIIIITFADPIPQIAKDFACLREMW